MKNQIDSAFKALFMSAAFGVIVWFPLNVLNQVLGKSPNDAWTLWYWIGYPMILSTTAALGYWAQNKTWLIGPVAVFASYIAALFFVPQSGNMLPFEVLWMAILSAPAAWAGKIGADFRER